MFFHLHPVIPEGSLELQTSKSLGQVITYPCVLGWGPQVLHCGQKTTVNPSSEIHIELISSTTCFDFELYRRKTPH